MAFKLPTRIPRILPPLLPEPPGKPVDFVRGQRLFPKGPDQWQPRVIEGGGKLPKLPEIEGMIPGGAIAKVALFLAGVAETWWNLHEASESEIEPTSAEPSLIIDPPPAGKTLPNWLHEMAELATLATLIAEKELRAFQLEKLGLSHEARQLRDEIEGLRIQLLTASKTYPLIHGALQAVASAGANGNTALASEVAAPSDPGAFAPTIRVGAPPLDDVPMLLGHIGGMLAGDNPNNRRAIRDGLKMVFQMLANARTLTGEPNDNYRLTAVSLSGRAARLFADGQFLEIARQEVQSLHPATQEIVSAALHEVDTHIRPYQLPSPLFDQLKDAVMAQQEIRAEGVVDQLIVIIFQKCQELIALWKDEKKVAAWAVVKIHEITEAVHEAGVALADRGIVHDIRNDLASLDARIFLAAESGLEALRAAVQKPPTRHIPRNLTEMLVIIGDRASPSVALETTGVDQEELAETVDGRELLVILRNVVGNAGQHPKDGQATVHVLIALVKLPGETIIRVTDNSDGMTAEIATHLLAGRPVHDGQTTDRSNPNEFHGFGWLRIREACTRLGIVPEINSTPGQGTTVTLHLPRGLLKSDTPRTTTEENTLLNRFLRAAVLDRVLLQELFAAQIGPYDPILDRLTTMRHTPDVLRAIARFRLQRRLPGISLPADLSPTATADALFRQDTPLFWKTMLTLVAGHPNADMRRFAVDMVSNIATRTTGQDKDQLALFVSTALRDSDATVVLQAWQLHRTTPVIDPGIITAEWLYSHEPAGSPQFGLAHYVFGSVNDQAARREALNAIMAASASQDTRIDLRTVQPLHSLADYNPDDTLRMPRLSYNRARIAELLGILGPTQRDAVVTTASFKGGQGFIAVLQFPSGHRLLLNGHHRGAALFQAAREGVIPASWLEDVPVKLYHYSGDMPEVLVRRLATLGATLTWEDLLPPNKATEQILAGFNDPQAVGRRDALQRTHQLLPELPNATDVAGLRRLLMRGLKDTNIGVIYEAWSLLTQHKLIDPATVTDDMFTWMDPPPVPQFGLARAFFLTGQLNLNRWARGDLWRKLYEDISIQDAVIPLHTIQPFHNPTYYDPAENISDQVRDARLEEELGRLQGLIRNAPHTPPEQVLARFMLGYSDKTRCLIDVFQFPSGWRMIRDGHHRTAVLLTAVRRGIMPAEWLDHIPASLHVYNGTLPEPYIRRILTYGVTLTWDDFLPPSSAEQAARARLKDPDPVVQWEAWKELRDLNPTAAQRVTATDLGPPAPFVAGTHGVARYVVRAPMAWQDAAVEARRWVERQGQWQKVRLDIRGICPAHSLADFMPEPLSQKYGHAQIMGYYFERLQALRKYYPSAAEYLDHFVNQAYTGQWTQISVIQLPSGIQIIHNGHHRLAALIKAAREGVIPEDWLQQVPGELLVVEEDSPIPEAVFLQIYAPAHTLTLDELLPPPDPK